MARYAILKVGNRQYRVEENDIINVERFSEGTATEQTEVKFQEVLLIGGDSQTRIGQPYLANSSVVCEVLGEEKQPKVISFKIKRRKGYRRKVGHRQNLVRLRIKKIVAE